MIAAPKTTAMAITSGAETSKSLVGVEEEEARDRERDDAEDAHDARGRKLRLGDQEPDAEDEKHHPGRGHRKLG